jgi:hypothetical protein
MELVTLNERINKKIILGRPIVHHRVKELPVCCGTQILIHTPKRGYQAKTGGAEHSLSHLIIIMTI